MVKRVLNKDVPVNVLRLQASEKNSNWSNKLFNSFINSISQEDIKFYPNLEGINNRLKDHFKVQNLMIGNGSDRCIEYFFLGHLDRKKVVVVSPSFPMYTVYSQLYNFEVENIPYSDLSFPYSKYLSCIDSTSICILTNPGSPLGDKIDLDFIEKVLQKGVPTLVDEAYIEFSDLTSCISLLDKYSNLFITRTFSKGLGSAGIRAGVILGSENGIDRLMQFRPMYEINSLSVKWMNVLLDNYNEVEEYILKVKQVRSTIIKKCYNLNIDIIEGHSNWIHIVYQDLPDNILFKKNCSIPGSNKDWVRLQITDNELDYTWLK